MATGLGQYGFGAKMLRYADAGKYFVWDNPTPGTGVSGIADSTAIAQTKSMLLLKNNNTVGSGIRLYLDYLRLSCTGAGVGHTTHAMVFDVETSQSVDRYTSGGTSDTPVNVNGDSSTASAVVARSGPLVTVAATSNRRIANIVMRQAVIGVVGDTFVFNFGAPGYGISGGVTEGTTQMNRSFAVPPIIIGPQQYFRAQVWGGSMSTSPAYEFSLGYVEV